MKPSDEVLRIIARAQAFCLDVDSTTIETEGIDELAAIKGKKDEIAKITCNALGGNMSFRESITTSLCIIQPSRHDVEKLNETSISFSKNIKELVYALLQHGKDVFLVSGGFRQLVHPIANQLGIGLDHVYANQLLFHPETGEFAGFDTNEPTSMDGGKARVIEIIKQRFNYETVVMVGDGANDLAARPEASIVIGYGGVVLRENVKREADWYITDFSEIIAVLMAS